MTEEQVIAAIQARVDVDAARFERLVHLVDATRREMAVQNLIAPSTAGSIWERHVLDSIQLVDIARKREARWLDIGTGGGFPGLVLGALSISVTCIEPRKSRAAFLETISADWPNVTILCERVERATYPIADVITARAVAPPSDIFTMAETVSNRATLWLLPAGRSAAERLEQIKSDWTGMFHVEQSVTDRASGIIVARDVKRRRR